MKPGIHNITIEQYHNGPGVSRSGLECFRRSPLHYWYEYLNHEKPIEERPEFVTKTDSLGFGNAFHAYLLEPEEFEKRYLVSDKPSRQSNAGKAAYAEIIQKAEGRQLIEIEAFREITEMQRSVNNHETASALIADGVYERSLFWEDKDSSLLCKARPDIWHSNMIVDIKTSKDASFRQFQRDLYNYGYYIQAGMIHEALHQLQDLNMMNFIYIVVEKEPPYAVAVYTLDENVVHKGIELFKKTIFDMKVCFDNDHWPSYPNLTLTLPEYI